MTDRQRSVEALFREAQRLPPEKRLEWLQEACAGDAALLREVSAMLDDATVQRQRAGDEPLTPGVYVSHYRLMDRLGAGGMGEVWLATDEKLGRQVALKFPTAIVTADPTSRPRLLREARSAAALDHAAVCRVYEFGEADADAAGIMNTGNLVVTPDGRSYAYWWHRALSDLYLVRGVS